ncbi:MAG: deoxynucleoside kinase [Bacteroidota bacterium]
MKATIPYKFICIEGNIGTGKTTFAEMISQEYSCELILEEFQDNPFLPFFYQDKERYALSVELFFLTERYKQLQRQLSNRGLFQDFIIADYYFVKSLLFAKNNLIDEEFRLFQKMWNVFNSSFPKPDILIYFHRSVETLMKFIDVRGRDYEKLIEPDYLLRIQETYFDYFKNILTFPVVILDLNELDFVKSTNHYEAIKHIISQKYLPGVHRVSLIV